MRTYNIYLDRIEISLGNSFRGSYTLEYKLVSLFQDLYQFYLSLPLGRGITYRRVSIFIEELVYAIVPNKSLDEAFAVGILRNYLCFLRRFKFPDFQINILNYV